MDDKGELFSHAFTQEPSPREHVEQLSSQGRAQPAVCSGHHPSRGATTDRAVATASYLTFMIVVD